MTILVLSWFGIGSFSEGYIAGGLQSWFVIESFLGGYIAGDIIFVFLGIRLPGLTLATVPEKIETSVSILDSIHISVSADGSKWLICGFVSVTLCVLIDYFVILHCSEISAAKHYFSSYILSLGD